MGRIRVVSESDMLYPWPLIYEEAPHVVTHANIIAQARKGEPAACAGAWVAGVRYCDGVTGRSARSHAPWM